MKGRKTSTPDEQQSGSYRPSIEYNFSEKALFKLIQAVNNNSSTNLKTTSRKLSFKNYDNLKSS